MTTLQINGGYEASGLPRMPTIGHEHLDLTPPSPPQTGTGRRILRLAQRVGTTAAGVGAAGAVTRDIVNGVESLASAGIAGATVAHQVANTTATSTFASGLPDAVTGVASSIFGAGSDALGYVATAWQWTIFAAKIAPWIGTGIAAYKLYNWWSGGGSLFGGGSSHQTHIEQHFHHHYGPQGQQEQQRPPTTATPPTASAPPVPAAAAKLAPATPKQEPIRRTLEENLALLREVGNSLGKAEVLHEKLNNCLRYYPDVKRDKINQLLKEFDAIEKNHYRSPQTIELVKQALKVTQEADEEISKGIIKAHDFHPKLKKYLTENKFILSPGLKSDKIEPLIKIFDEAEKTRYDVPYILEYVERASAVIREADAAITSHTEKTVRHLKFAAKKMSMNPVTTTQIAQIKDEKSTAWSDR